MKVEFNKTITAPRIDVQPLPREFRLIEVTNYIELTSRTLDDDVDEEVKGPGFAGPYFLGPLDDLNADVGAHAKIKLATSLPTEGRVEIVIEVSRGTGGAIRIDSINGHYFDDDEEDADWNAPSPVLVAEDGSFTYTIDLKSGETWPDRAHVQFTLFNRRMP